MMLILSQKQALAETETVLASMKGKIESAVEELDSQLVCIWALDTGQGNC